MKVIGVDVAKDFIVAYDGKTFYVFPEIKKIPKKRLPKKTRQVKFVNDISEIAKSGDVVILEQTGTYGIKFAKLFENIGAKVLIADGKALARFRIGKSTLKNDYVDAQAIREMYFSPRRRNIHPFHAQRYQLRTMIRHYLRLNKELTRAVNRFKQQLVHLFPSENYHNYSRYRLFKSLDQIENKLLQHPESLSIVALSELHNIRNITSSIEKVKKEIESVVINHPDYEILKSFQLGVIQMAALIAYYWDISLFRSKDSFIGYCLMGVKHEQSGESVLSNRTDKSRAEIKGIFYMHFQRAYMQKSPFRPLALYMKLRESEYKRRYIKYLDRLLEWIYYGLKYRLTFKEVIEKSIIEKREQLLKLEEIIKQKETKEDKYYYQQLLERYRNTSDWFLVCQDISTLLNETAKSAAGVECQDYYKEEPPNGGNENEMGKKGICKTYCNENARVWQLQLYNTNDSRGFLESLHGDSQGRSFNKGKSNIYGVWDLGKEQKKI